MRLTASELGLPFWSVMGCSPPSLVPATEGVVAMSGRACMDAFGGDGVGCWLVGWLLVVVTVVVSLLLSLLLFVRFVHATVFVIVIMVVVVAAAVIVVVVVFSWLLVLVLLLLLLWLVAAAVVGLARWLVVVG